MKVRARVHASTLARIPSVWSTRLIHRWRIAAIALLVCSLPSACAAQVSIGLLVRSDGGGGVERYRAWIQPGVFPGNPELPFTTAQIRNQSGVLGSETVGLGWGAPLQPFFPSLQSLIAELDQPWHLRLDAGLPTQRDYQMSLNLGALPSLDMRPPMIHSPLANATVTSLQPTFQFELHPDFAFSALLFGTGVSTGWVPLPQGATSWTPAVTLTDGEQYLFDILSFNNSVDGLGFSAPVDSQGNAIPNWGSWASIELEAVHQFAVAVPEPGSLALLLIGALVLGTRRLHARRDRAVCRPE